MTDTLYRLRGLEWVKMHGAWTAKSPIGRYFIWENQGVFRWQFSDEDEQLADSLSAAQSAADAHYRARMAEGLVEVKVKGSLAITADGVVVSPAEDPLFVWNCDQWANHGRVVCRPDGKWGAMFGECWQPIEKCHSTRTATEAAKKEPVTQWEFVEHETKSWANTDRGKYVITTSMFGYDDGSWKWTWHHNGLPMGTGTRVECRAACRSHYDALAANKEPTQ